MFIRTKQNSWMVSCSLQWKAQNVFLSISANRSSLSNKPQTTLSHSQNSPLALFGTKQNSEFRPLVLMSSISQHLNHNQIQICRHNPAFFIIPSNSVETPSSSEKLVELGFYLAMSFRQLFPSSRALSLLLLMLELNIPTGCQ